MSQPPLPPVARRSRGLIAFVLRRVARALPVVAGIALLNFFIIRLAPGDVVDALAGDAGGATPEYMAHLRAQFGLDRPLPVQLWRYILGLLHGDLGYSHRLAMPVAPLIFERLPATALLIGAATLLAVLIGGGLGIVQARHPGSWRDSVISILILITHSIPSFWLGLMAIVFVSAGLGWFPSGGYTSFTAPQTGWRHGSDVLYHLVLPALTLANFYLATYARLMRASLLELHGAAFIRTARAKGASEWQVLWRHALPNALLPVFTLLGVQLGTMVSGAVIVESIFGWPGLGRLTFEAILARDFNLLLGVLLIGSVVVVCATITIDVAQRLLDPRLAGEWS